MYYKFYKNIHVKKHNKIKYLKIKLLIIKCNYANRIIFFIYNFLYKYLSKTQ